MEMVSEDVNPSTGSGTTKGSINIPPGPPEGPANKSKDTNNPQSPPEYTKQSTESNFRFENGVLYLDSLSNGTPFLQITDVLRKKVEDGGRHYCKDLGQYGDVKSSIITNGNIYYQAGGTGKLPSGLIQSDLIYRAKNKGLWTTAAQNWYGSLKSNCVIPNCVGQARGRYEELRTGLHETNTNYHCPNNDPGGWPYENPWSRITTGGQGTTWQNTNVKVWKDESGTYGPVNGLWGYAKMQENTPVLPGCFIVWTGHIEFIEAVYNFGKPDEYIITSSSASGHYTLNKLFFGCYRVNRKGGTYLYDRTDYYEYARQATILYTPLCDFNGTGDFTVTTFPHLELNYESPTPEQLANLDKIQRIIGAAGIDLKENDYIQIMGTGNSKSDGSGTKVLKKLMKGWVKKVHDKGKPFPYEIMDKQTNGSRIGYFKRSDLKLFIN